MASVFKPSGSKKYVIMWRDENGKRHKRIGCTDKAESERIGNHLENQKALRRDGLFDDRDEAYRDHRRSPLARHIADWQADLVAKGHTSSHAEHTSNRVRRLVTVLLGSAPSQFDPRRLAPEERSGMTGKLEAAIARARLPILTREAVQDALARFRDSGTSLQTCNHYRAAARAFSNWCHKSGRIRVDELRGVTGFNAKEDRRHDRRTLGLEELQRLIDSTHRGPKIAGLTGPTRALCYRLAIASGLRYTELASLTPGSFDFENGPSVTVEAAYAKNGQTATLFLPSDLADDLAAYLATLEPEANAFPLPPEKGARMLRKDLARAGIPYRDASGLVFEFHSLRCQCATLADQAGVTPRVVQKIMRHSSLELTGAYPRPRAVDIESAASMLPSLKPSTDEPESLVMTGTDPAPISLRTATEVATEENSYACKSSETSSLRQMDRGLRNLYPSRRAAALTIATMPARIASGSSGQAATKAARSGSV
jgi:integrase